MIKTSILTLLMMYSIGTSAFSENPLKYNLECIDVISSECKSISKFNANVNKVDQVKINRIIEIRNVLITQYSEYKNLSNKQFLNEVVIALYNAEVEFNISYKLLISMTATESGFNPKAVSRVGSTGLLQIYPRMWKDLSKTYRLNSVSGSINAGAFIINEYYYNRCNKSLNCTIKSYNIGITNHKKNKSQDAASRYMVKVIKNYPGKRIVLVANK